MPPLAKKLVKPSTLKPKKEEKEKKLNNVVSKQLQKKLDKRLKKKENRPDRGVILIRHLPKEFLEEQLRKYFEQFGHVTRLRLARSRKTGGPKGFAYIEFAVPEVAQIAAKTMDNYLMFRKIVKAHYIPPSEQKYNYFKSKLRKVTTAAGKEIFVSGKTKAIHKQAKLHNIWDDHTYQIRTEKQLRKSNELQKKYMEAGLDIDDYQIAPKMVKVRVNSSVSDDANVTESTSTDSKIINGKKGKISKNIALKVLLENTLPDKDSDDDDYLPNGSAELESDSDNSLCSMEDDGDENSLNSEEEEESNSDTEEDLGFNTKPLKISKKTKQEFEDTTIACLNKLTNRISYEGRIQKKRTGKLVKKPINSRKSATSAVRSNVKNAAFHKMLESESVKMVKKSDFHRKTGKKM